MIACTDVDYRSDHAIAACVLFQAWRDATSTSAVTARIDNVEPYVPGQFFKRELPCILEVLKRIPDPIEIVVVDGYVWLDDIKCQPGLGAHLFATLHGRIPVVGVAKKIFATASPEIVLRGSSNSPLYVTAEGVDVKKAAEYIRIMDGPHRIPTLLKCVDSLCRTTQLPKGP